MDLNNVCMQGELQNLEIMWCGQKECFYSGILNIVRSKETIDKIPIVISESLLNTINIDNKLVSIMGQVRSKDIIENDRLKVKKYIYVNNIHNIKHKDFKNENLIEMCGYICKRPNIRNTPSGKQITDLLIACNYGKDKTAYISSIAWGRNARVSSKFKVGDYVYVRGKFQSRDYTKIIDGISCKKTAYELSIDEIK